MSTQTNNSNQQKRITFADQLDQSSRSSSPSNTFSSSSARSSTASSSSGTTSPNQQLQPTEDDSISIFDSNSKSSTQFPLPPTTTTTSHQLSPIQETPMPFSSSKAIVGTKLYPTSRHRTARKQCIDKLQTFAHSDLKDWKHIGDRNNTQLYTQATEGSTLPIMRSETTFVGSWTPEQICSVIQCFGARKECKY